MTVQNDELAASRACHVELASGVIDGRVVATAEFVAFDGETSETDWFEVRGPDEPGDHTWFAAVPFPDETPPDVTRPVVFTVRAHGLNVVVWDVPSAIVRGETFAIHVVRIRGRTRGPCILRGSR